MEHYSQYTNETVAGACKLMLFLCTVLEATPANDLFISVYTYGRLHWRFLVMIRKLMVVFQKTQDKLRKYLCRYCIASDPTSAACLGVPRRALTSLFHGINSLYFYAFILK